jgi:hypothetical protein
MREVLSCCSTTAAVPVSSEDNLMLKHTTVRTIEAFVKTVSDAREHWRLRETLPWFRGQASVEWPLVPNLYRQSDRSRRSEDEVREEFITRAPALAGVTPTGKWDWYFLMQHHGAPTRLLDWTEGALMGLYFAVRENPGHHHAGVWVLDPWELNKRFLRRDEVVPPGDPGTTSRDRSRYDKWLPERFAPGKRWPRWPVAIYPGHTMRRIQAQRSCFTIHGSDQRSLDVILARLKVPLLRITIPSWESKAIRRTLETCGVDETTIFPDLEGLGKQARLRWMEPEEVSPHRNALTRLGPSKIHKGGVGVFAIRKIKRGAPLFVGDNDEMLWVREDQLPRVPRSVRELYDDFAVRKTDEEDGKLRYGCPLNFNRLTISWYLNEPNSSKRANVRCDEFYNFFATEDIRPGDELTINYPAYSE